MGTMRLSKRTIVLNVANRDGGAHIDDTVPDSHTVLSAPPFFFKMGHGGHVQLMQPNIAYGITAQAGCEMQECLQRNFGCSE